MRTLTCAIWGRCWRNFVLWERVRVCFWRLSGVWSVFICAIPMLETHEFPHMSTYSRATVPFLFCNVKLEVLTQSIKPTSSQACWQNHCTGIFAKQGLLCFGVTHQTALVGCHPIFLKMPFGFQTQQFGGYHIHVYLYMEFMSIYHRWFSEKTLIFSCHPGLLLCFQPHSQPELTKNQIRSKNSGICRRAYVILEGPGGVSKIV